MNIYAGLDVHSAYTYGTIMDEKGNHMWESKFPTNDLGFKNFFAKFKTKHKITAVFEASRNWNHVAKLLHQQEVETIMAHPLRVRAIASARVKTDKIDSKVLADLLRGNLIPQSYMPPEDIVELRNLVRHRVRLGRLAARNGVKHAHISPSLELSRSDSLARALDFLHALSLPLPSHLLSFFPAP